MRRQGRPDSRVVLSDAEAAEAVRKANKGRSAAQVKKAVDDALSEREARRSALQASYVKNPPAKAYRAPKD